MGHEVIGYGIIEGAAHKIGEEYTKLQKLNEETIKALPKDDDWPWVDGSIFSLPGRWPNGTYLTQVIHFGLSLKDDPSDDSWLDKWLSKFEDVLRKLYWDTALFIVETDFHPRRQFTWVPTERAINEMIAPPNRPIFEWTRYQKELPKDWP